MTKRRRISQGNTNEIKADKEEKGGGGEIIERVEIFAKCCTLKLQSCITRSNR